MKIAFSGKENAIGEPMIYPICTLAYPRSTIRQREYLACSLLSMNSAESFKMKDSYNFMHMLPVPSCQIIFSITLDTSLFSKAGTG